MATLQVKGMNDHLYAALKRKAELGKRSLSQEVIAILEGYFSPTQTRSEYATQEFLKLCASWEGEEDAETLIKEIRSSRKSQSRQKRLGDVFD